MNNLLLSLTSCKAVVRVFFFVLLPFFSIAQSDDCATATPITSSTSCNNTPGTLKGAGATTSIAAYCGNAGSADVWYSFTAQSAYPTISLSSMGTSLAVSPRLQLFTASCSPLSSLGCVSGANTTTLSLSVASVVGGPGLTIGATYYIRVFTNTTGTAGNAATWNFNICVTDDPLIAPANDLCNNAIALTSSTTCVNTAGTLVGATYTAIASIGCGTTARNDVWYSFTAQSTSPTITLSTGVANPRMQLFSGSCSSGLTSVACGNSSINATGLTIGATYFIRVYADPNATGIFNICVTDPPANDLCANATSLTSSTICNTTSGTLNAASTFTATTNACGTNNDVWYSFVAKAPNPTITLSGTPADARAQIMAGTCAGGFTAVGACPTSTTTAASGLTVGTTYYVRVYSASNATGTFDICVTDPPPAPANNECAGAISLTTGTTFSAGTVFNATASTGIPTGCATGTPDDDVWFKFTPVSNGAIITLSSLGSDLSASGARFQLFSGSCGSLTSLSCGSGTTALVATGLTIGTPYFIRVYSSGAGSIGSASAGSVFSITVNEPAASRMNEVFKQTNLATGLDGPWEVTYGLDDYLWITESKNYKVYRMDPNTGSKTTILDISPTGTGYLTPAEHTTFNRRNNFTKWPQGGLAGLAIHPDFMHPTAPKKYVYLSYVYKYDSGPVSSGGIYYTNWLVRFTYNTSSQKLEAPVMLCDTLPGSSDHNSQRMIIAPVNGTNYLFYASGDMGSGQYDNTNREIKAQYTGSYEGKILRFNLEEDAMETDAYAKWIPNDNPFSDAKQSAVWSIGMRNNQGFAFANIGGQDLLYGSSHGPFSDDEFNLIEKGKNYGHPLVIGYKDDGNYNNAKAGVAAGSLPLIVSETGNAAAWGAAYKDPFYSFYPSPAGNTTTPSSIQFIYTNQNYTAPYSPTGPAQSMNRHWASEAPSGMDIYTNTVIPGWKNSLVIASLKWGRVMRMKLNADGTGVVPTNGQDTISYFDSDNRFRDVAFSPDGRDLFVGMDKDPASSGPSQNNPIVPACAGCVQKYTFLGYRDQGGKSTIPTAIDVTTGTANTCTLGTTVTINSANNNTNLWVPITGPDGNIMAEIKANGNNLGTVTSSFYINGGAVRENNLKRLYLNRNITITPQTQPSSPVSIRLYLTANELTALKNASNSRGSSGVTSISNVSIYKNSDACGSTWVNTATPDIITPIYAENHGSNGHVLQADINSFSSFYFANSNITLPLQLLTFKGSLQNNAALLQWETANEVNTSHFVVERSIDGANFTTIGTVAAAGHSTATLKYNYIDNQATLQPATKLYYRLKQVDENGSYTYSKTIIIELTSVYTVSMHPNPVNDVLKIQFSLPKAQQVQIYVTDMNGRDVYKGSRFASKGQSELEINTKAWPAQLYSIRITGGDNKTLAVQNVIKL